MKNVLVLDTFREIKKSFGRFLSIFAIVAIGVAFFAGVKASAPVMKYTADTYFDDYNLMDLRIVSPLGLTDEDVLEMKNISGVNGVFPTHSMDVLTTIDSIEVVSKVHGLAIDNLNDTDENYINRPVLVEGRYPEKSGECLVEQRNLDDLDVKIGEKIVLESGTSNNITQTLNTKEYTVVGIATTPYYLSFEKGSSEIGNGRVNNFIMIPEEDFKSNVYTEVFLTVNGAKELNSYSDKYFDVIDKVSAELEDLSEIRMPIRMDELQIPSNTNIQKDKAQTPKWIVLDRNSHYSYVDYGGSADRIDAISKVFPVFFFLVAALVCLTTMTRMVDEQRINIGTLKALGYNKISIASKYIVYAAFASVAGSVVGILIGYTVFPIIIYNAYGIMYTMPSVILRFDIPLAIISTLAAVLITTMAAVFACYKELIETPSLLMRPKAPKEGKRILLERLPFLWKRLSFTEKVTARNIFRYKKRFFMTVIGISGCTALLLAGFGIKDSIGTIVDKQFGQIFKYDATIDYEKTSSISEKDAVFENLNNDSRFKELMLVSKSNVKTASVDTDEISTTLVVPSEINKFKDFTTLKGRVNKNEQLLENNGVVITEKLSRLLNVSNGDVISLNNGNNLTYDVKVTGISENYMDHYVYMSPEYYETIFDNKPDFNSILGKLENPSIEVEDALAEELNKNTSIKSITFFTGIANSFNDTIKSLNLVVIVLIISAGSLAFVVLYNLTNVNISERLREIATIKVLGFYDKEVSAYVYRENLLLTAIGTLTGLGLGTILHRFIMITVELDNVMFGRNISGMSYVYGAVLTMMFAVFVNLVMYYKLKNIPMVESLKSVD